MLRKGRPVKFNRKELKPQKGKEYAEIVFFGDLHYGASTCLTEKAKKMLDYCLANNVYVHFMGD